MNVYLMVLVALRAAALGLSVANPKRGEQLLALSDLIESGVVTNAHMAKVADLLKNGHPTDADFDDVLARIDQHRKDLHGDAGGDA